MKIILHPILYYLFVLVLLVLSFKCYAEPVDSLRAQNFAENFFRNLPKSSSNLRAVAPTFSLVDKPQYQNLEVNPNVRTSTKDEYLYYAFNVGDNNGFIIISGDDSVVPVLAYSTSGKFDPNTGNPGVKMFMEYYKASISHHKKLRSVASFETNAQWIINSNRNNRIRVNPAFPLIKTKWKQKDGLYNKLTPSGIQESSVAGCVAVALAQVIRYHEYPSYPKGIAKYKVVEKENTDGTFQFKTIEKRFGSTFTYNWNFMPVELNSNSTDNEIVSVANLIADCGMAVGSSYTSASTSASPSSIVTALTNNFNYSESARLISQDKLTNTWTISQLNKFEEELDSGRPILLGGRFDKGGDGVTDGGHRFVLDGHDSNRKYHINWGWGSSYQDDLINNGYYTITDLNPSPTNYYGSAGFSIEQSAVIGIQPANSCDHFYPRTRADVPSVYWYAPYAEFATQFGLVESVNSSFNENKIISIGDAAKTISLTAKRLGDERFYEVFNEQCNSNSPNQIFVDLLLNLGYLSSAEAQDSNMDISFGLLSRLINEIILGSDFPKAYRNANYTKAEVSPTATNRSSILAIINIKGVFEGVNGRTKAEYISAGFKDAVITGNEVINNATLSKFITNAFVFKYKSVEKKNESPEGEVVDLSEELTNSQDYIIVGDKYEIPPSNGSILEPSELPGRTEFMRSNTVANWAFPADTLSDGTSVHFYWTINGANDGIALEPNTVNFQSVKITTPSVSEEKKYLFYIYLGAANKRSAETYKEIIVRPDLGSENTNLLEGEYFVDVDPGVGQGTPIFDNYTKYGIDSSLNIDTGNLQLGEHIVGIRVRDSNNLWSATDTTTFEVNAVCEPVTALIAGTQTINEGESADLILSFTGSAPYSYSFSNGLNGTTSDTEYTLSVSPSFTTTYTLSAVSNECGEATITTSEVTVTVVPVCVTPNPPSVTNVSRCGTGEVTLNATGCNNIYRWYTTNVGGSSIASGANYATPSLSATTTYYVSCVDGNCESSRAAALVTIKPVPNSPNLSASPSTITVGESSTLSAANCAGTVIWNNGLGSGLSKTVSPTETKTYKAVCNDNGCTSDSTSIEVTVEAIVLITPPVISSSTSSICSGGAVTLSASGCENGIIEWSNMEVGVSINSSPIVNTVYSAICRESGEVSVSSNEVTITVLEIPQSPVLNASSATITVGESSTLSATNCGGVVVWNNGLGSGTSKTVMPSETETYKAVCTDNGCTSDSASVEITAEAVVVIAPPIISSSTNSICSGEAVTISATGCENGIIEWSNMEVGVSINSSPIVNTVYSAICREGEQFSSASNEVTIEVLAIPQKPTLNISSASITVGDSVEIIATNCSVGIMTWSNGFDGVSQWVSPASNQTISVHCENTGCRSDSSFVNIEVSGRPFVYINAGDLCADSVVVLSARGVSPQSKLQWYLNGEKLTGATDSLYAATVSGNYSVAVMQEGEPEWIRLNPDLQNNSFTNTQLREVHFIDDKRGWALGVSQVFYTSDGGENWDIQITGNYEEYWNKIQMLNDTLGYISSGKGNIVKTINGGQTWVYLPTGTNSFLYGIHFIDDLRGWAVGSQGTVIKTVDGGNTWSTVSTPISGTNKSGISVHFLNANDGFIGLNEVLETLVTNDGGQTWSIDPSLAYIWEYQFLDDTTGYSLGAGGLRKTTDAGQNWVTSIYNLYDFNFINDSLGFIVNSQNQFFKTTDSGLTWLNLPATVTSDILSIDFISEDQGWAVGNGGQILKFQPKLEIVRLSDSISINKIISAPQVTFPPQAICSGDLVTLTANGCENGDIKWSDNQVGTTINVTPIISQSYKAVCLKNGCVSDSSNEVTITVLEIPQSPVLNANSATITVGESSTLSATNCVGVVVWNNGLGNGITKIVSPLETKTYKAVCNNNGCTSDSSSIEITVEAVVVITPPNISSSTNSICSGETVTLSATGCENGIIEWSNMEVGNAIDVTPLVNTTYNAICREGGQFSSASNEITIEVLAVPQKPTLNISSTTITIGDSVEIIAANCSAGTLTWSNGFNGVSQWVSPTSSQIISVHCENTGCRSDSSFVNIEVSGRPFVYINAGDLCADSVVVLSARGVSPQSKLQWYLNGEKLTGATDSLYAATVSGNYSVAVMQEGEPEWIWQNPVSNGNELTDSYFIGDKGWAIGKGGTILRTTNKGASWQALGSQITQNLNGIHFLNEYDGWVVGERNALYKTSDGGNTWIRVVVGVANEFIGFKDISFRNHRGLIVGNSGTILRTQDGGTSWSSIASATTQTLNAIAFVSEQQIWIAGDRNQLLKSIDGGQSWVGSYTNTNTSGWSDFQAVDFSDALNGWAVGGSTIEYPSFDPMFPPMQQPGPDVLLKTSDGGQTWGQSTFNNSFTENTSVKFSDSSVGWVSDDKGHVYNTINAGTSWQVQSPELGKANNLNVVGLDSVFVFGLNGNIFKTTDGGQIWDNYQKALTTASIRSASFVDSLHGWAIAGGQILKNINDGKEWEVQYTGGTFWNNIQMLNDTTGYVVGSSGQVIKTIDGGVNWNYLNTNSSSYLSSLHFINDQVGWVVGDQTILKTTDGGQSWTNLPTSLADDYNRAEGVHFMNPDTGFVGTSYNYLLKTINGGNTWSKQYGVTYYVNKFQFLNEGVGYLMGNEMMKTTNGGASWFTIGTFANDFHFINDTLGFTASFQGLVQKTSDGGTDWINMNSLSGNNLHAIHFTDEKNGWTLGDGGHIMKYQNRLLPVSQSDDVFLNNVVSAPLITTSDSTICGGSSITLAASNCGNGVYKWNNGQIGSTITVAPSTTTVYKVTCQQNTCVSDSSNAVSITVYQVPTKPVLSIGDTTICEGDSLIVSATGCLNSTLIWSNNFSGNSQIINPEQSLTLSAFCQPFVGCPSLSSAIDITVFDKPYIYADTTNLCTASTVTLRARGVSELTKLQWFKDGVILEGETDSLLTVTSIGNYSVASMKNGSTATWNWQNPNFSQNISLTSSQLRDVDFVNESKGWAIGATQIFNTVDGGKNWNVQFNGDYWNKIQMLNDSVGYAASGSGTIAKTTNGGINWNYTPTGVTNYFYSMHFSDANHGWAVGDYGTIIKTVDGGQSWQPITSPLSGSYYSYEGVYFTSPDTGYVGVSGFNYGLKTTDGGQTWVYKYDFPAFTSKFQFTSSQVGYLMGNDMRKSTDGGNTWTYIGDYAIDFHFVNDSVGFKSNINGIVQKTTNGGVVWTPLNTPSGEHMWAIDFLEENLGWAVGGNGNILNYSPDLIVACESSSIEITKSIPVPQITSPPQIICSEDSVTLTASGCSEGMIKWNNNQIGSSISVQPVTSQTYSAICQQNNCTSDSSNAILISVIPKSFSSVTLTECDSTKSPSGRFTYFTSGIYTDTLVNSVGCDSIITVNLTINKSTSRSTTLTVCNSYTSPSGKFVWTNSGVYTDTLINSVGCDSIISINLTILQPVSGILSGVKVIVPGQSAILNIAFTGTPPYSATVNGQTYNNIPQQNFNFNVSPTENTNYTLTSVSNTCGIGVSSGQAIVTIDSNNPCPSIREIPLGISDIGLYKAAETIKSSATVGSPTTYKAGNSIELKPGFKADNGIIFKAEIGNCNN